MAADQNDEHSPSATAIDALGEAAGAARSALFEALDELDAFGGGGPAT